MALITINRLIRNLLITDNSYLDHQGNIVKLFKNDDAFFDRVSKISTIFATTGTLAFGIYAYFNTIHPVFEKEKELQGLRAEKLSLESEKSRLSTDNLLLKNKFIASSNRLNELNEKLNKTNTVLLEKQNFLDKLNRDLVVAQKQTILGKLDMLREKLLSTAIYQISTKGKTKFDIISYSSSLLPDKKKKLSPTDKKAYEYFEDYIHKNSNQEIEEIDDIIKYAVMLPVSYKIKENMLNDND